MRIFRNYNFLYSHFLKIIFIFPNTQASCYNWISPSWNDETNKNERWQCRIETERIYPTFIVQSDFDTCQMIVIYSIVVFFPPIPSSQFQYKIKFFDHSSRCILQFYSLLKQWTQKHAETERLCKPKFRYYCNYGIILVRLISRNSSSTRNSEFAS